VLECVPSIDEIIEYDEKGKHRNIWAKWQLARQLKEKNFDHAFLLRPSRSRAMVLAWAKIPHRIGYSKEAVDRYLTQTVSEPDAMTHRSDYYLKVIEEAGIPVTKRLVSLEITPQVTKEAQQILASKGLSVDEEFLVLNPGGNWLLKRWPASRYRALAQALISDGKRLVLTGAPSDTDLLQEICQGLDKRAVIDLSGATNIKQLLAVLKMAKAVISGDSGPLHLAASVGTDTIALFGPTRPDVTAPRGKGKVRILQKDIGCNISPCYFLDCPNNQCMQMITVEEVLHAVKRIGR